MGAVLSHHLVPRGIVPMAAETGRNSLSRGCGSTRGRVAAFEHWHVRMASLIDRRARL